MNNDLIICRDYMELLKRSAGLFGERLFLEDDNEKVSFEKFYRNILCISSAMNAIAEKYITLNISDQLLFSEAYFAGVITGHTVILGDYGTYPYNNITVGEENIREYIKFQPIAESKLPPQEPDAVCTVAFSSGTTSKSKGVLLSQRNLIFDSFYSTKNFRFSVGERLIHILPFQHLFGLVADLITSLYSGSCMFIVNSPMLFFKAMKYFRPHCINMPPALADAICFAAKNCENISEITGGCLKRVLCAGAPMKENTFYELQKHGILPCMAYGLTECSPCISITKGDDVIYGTSGCPIECVDVKISENGEILVAGDILMKGYSDGSESEKITDGYFHTGDIGKINENGHLVVLGRLNTMIVFSNGKKCMPETIEEQIDSVAGVDECILQASENGIDAELIVVSHENEVCREKIEKIMKDEGLFPFILRLQTEKLSRNKLGKVIRNGI